MTDTPFHHFLIPSMGACGATWLAGSLSLHDEIMCPVGNMHPFEALHHYRQKPVLPWLAGATPEMFRFGAVGSYLRQAYDDAGLACPLTPPRDMEAFPTYLFDELEAVAAPTPCRFLGNVHGTMLWQLYRASPSLRRLFGGRTVPVVNLIRHPVPRTECAIKMLVNQQPDEVLTLAADYAARNAEACREMEKSYGVDFQDLRSAAALVIFRLHLVNELWGEDLAKHPQHGALTLEGLQSDERVFANTVERLCHKRIVVGKDYLDKVFSPQNLSAGRNVWSPTGTLPPGEREQFSRWSAFEQAEFRRVHAAMRLDQIYGRFGYDFSFV